MVLLAAVLGAAQQRRVGEETGLSRHLEPGEERRLSIAELIAHGRRVFGANWTESDGAGRPTMTGTGAQLGSGIAPLTGARAFNRVSGPDANSCRGCHNEPYSIAGGSGDFVTAGFETAERFPFVSFDRRPARPEGEDAVEHSLGDVGNVRATPGLFGAGYIEVLAQQMTQELQRIRDAIRPGQSRALISKGVSFGTLAREAGGEWDTRRVEGLPPQSLTASASSKPSLVVQPWRQTGSVASLREFTITSFHRHMGMQAAERFGGNVDADGDGVANELTTADITAVTLFQATLPVPGRVIPNDPRIERAIASGERIFASIGCTTCHVPSLTIEAKGWKFGNVDLTDPALPQPRLVASARGAALEVPAYTDLKLHDITDPVDPDAADPVDMNQRPGTPEFAAGNRKFLTARLWGAANQSPYFHHGQFTTMRQAILAHAGEALATRRAFEGLEAADRDAVIEFLKSLQVLPPGTRALVIDEHGKPKQWPRRAATR